MEKEQSINIYIDRDQYIFKGFRPRQKNVAMALIDDGKAYDMAPQSYIIECPKMYKIFNKFINVVMKAMKNRKVESVARGQKLLR